MERNRFVLYTFGYDNILNGGGHLPLSTWGPWTEAPRCPGPSTESTLPSVPRRLTYDGSHLWVFTNDLSYLVREVGPSGDVASALLGPSQDVGGLTYDGKHLLLGVRGLSGEGDTIYAFDSALDMVTAICALGDGAQRIPGLVFDGTKV
jgi:hypothetical protein